jgi:hypothetical protein
MNEEAVIRTERISAEEAGKGLVQLNKMLSGPQPEMGSALREIIERISAIQRIEDRFDLIRAYVNTLEYGNTKNLPDSYSTEAPDIENDIKSLKKRIKYAKTPMERKMYEQQLNATYKKRKQKQ